MGKSAEGNGLVSIGHRGQQNGDLMRDTDMVLEFHQGPDSLAAEPVSFRNVTWV